ncbi:MAG: DUF2061 domain-containing protein [Rhodobacter sp.]|nr:DUF2061 domain-containing protein [Rhodobacter sp.]
METGRRTVVKAVLWNLLGLTVMALVGFAATGSMALGGGMAVVNAALGFVVYLIYERIWTRISWGRVQP